MNVTVSLYSVLIVLGVVGFGYAAWSILYALHLSARRTNEETSKLREAVALNTAALVRMTEALAPACDELRTHMMGIPKLLEAVVSVGNAQLEILQGQREVQRNPFGKPNGPRAPRDVASQNQEFDVRQLQRAEGISREEAMLRMNGANQRSVWEGNDIFEGWNR